MAHKPKFPKQALGIFLGCIISLPYYIFGQARPLALSQNMLEYWSNLSYGLIS